MVAAKDLQIGEVIIKEQPLVVGPCTACNVQCLGCYHPLEDNEEYAKYSCTNKNVWKTLKTCKFQV